MAETKPPDPTFEQTLALGTGIEVLACGNGYLEKDAQDPALAEDYKDQFELD